MQDQDPVNETGVSPSSQGSAETHTTASLSELENDDAAPTVDGNPGAEADAQEAVLAASAPPVEKVVSEAPTGDIKRKEDAAKTKEPSAPKEKELTGGKVQKTDEKIVVKDGKKYRVKYIGGVAGRGVNFLFNDGHSNEYLEPIEEDVSNAQIGDQPGSAGRKNEKKVVGSGEKKRQKSKDKTQEAASTPQSSAYAKQQAKAKKYNFGLDERTLGSRDIRQVGVGEIRELFQEQAEEYLGLKGNSLSERVTDFERRIYEQQKSGLGEYNKRLREALKEQHKYLADDKDEYESDLGSAPESIEDHLRIQRENHRNLEEAQSQALETRKDFFSFDYSDGIVKKPNHFGKEQIEQFHKRFKDARKTKLEGHNEPITSEKKNTWNGQVTTQTTTFADDQKTIVSHREVTRDRAGNVIREKDFVKSGDRDKLILQSDKELRDGKLQDVRSENFILQSDDRRLAQKNEWGRKRTVVRDENGKAVGVTETTSHWGGLVKKTNRYAVAADGNIERLDNIASNKRYLFGAFEKKSVAKEDLETGQKECRGREESWRLFGGAAGRTDLVALRDDQSEIGRTLKARNAFGYAEKVTWSNAKDSDARDVKTVEKKFQIRANLFGEKPYGPVFRQKMVFGEKRKEDGSPDYSKHKRDWRLLGWRKDKDSDRDSNKKQTESATNWQSAVAKSADEHQSTRVSADLVEHKRLQGLCDALGKDVSSRLDESKKRIKKLEEEKEDVARFHSLKSKKEIERRRREKEAKDEANRKAREEFQNTAKSPSYVENPSFTDRVRSFFRAGEHNFEQGIVAGQAAIERKTADKNKYENGAELEKKNNVTKSHIDPERIVSFKNPKQEDDARNGADRKSSPAVEGGSGGGNSEREKAEEKQTAQRTETDRAENAVPVSDRPAQILTLQEKHEANRVAQEARRPKAIERHKFLNIAGHVFHRDRDGSYQYVKENQGQMFPETMPPEVIQQLRGQTFYHGGKKFGIRSVGNGLKLSQLADPKSASRPVAEIIGKKRPAYGR